MAGKFSKVILLALLALGLAVAAGCGGSDEETAAPPAEAPAEEPPAEPPAETGAPPAERARPPRSPRARRRRAIRS